MRRNMIAALLAALLALGLAACETTDTTEPGTEEPGVEEDPGLEEDPGTDDAQ